jgi:glycopeptide antibiotics resistance protein
LDWIEILGYHLENLSAAEVLLGLFLAAVLAAYLTKRCQKGMLQSRQALCIWASFVYIYMVYLITIFSRSPRSEAEYMLTPFWSYAFIIQYENEAVLQENILNFLLFMPVGVLLQEAFRTRKAGKWITLGALALSISIEVLQLLLKRGLFEWDDMFHNALGAYISCRIWYALRRRTWERKSA